MECDSHAKNWYIFHSVIKSEIIRLGITVGIRFRVGVNNCFRDSFSGIDALLHVNCRRGRVVKGVGHLDHV